MSEGPTLFRRRWLFKAFDENKTPDRRRGIRIGHLLWQEQEPPYHYEHRWFQATMMTWPEGPARKVQFEIKTYRTAGMKSVDGSKRYIRFSFCL